MDEQTITDTSQSYTSGESTGSQLEAAVDVAAEVQTADTQPTQAESVSESGTDNELLEWAKAKNLDPSDPIKALQVARETERQYHANQQQASELRKQLETNVQPSTDDSEAYGYTDPAIMAKLDLLESRQAVNDFYSSNPDAKALDTEMATLVQSKPYLAQDLEALYTLAKAAKYDGDLKAAETRGRNEAKAQLAREGSASITSGNSTVATPTSPKLSPEVIANMSAEEYAAHRAEIKSAYN